MRRKIAVFLLRVWAVAVLAFTVFSGWYRAVVPLDPPAVDGFEQALLDSALQLHADTLWFFRASRLRHHPSGLWELYMEGDAWQRGVAHGALMRPFLCYQERAFWDFIRETVPSESYLKLLRFGVAFFNRNLPEHIPLEFQREILALSAFHADTFDFIGPKYERVLQYHAAHDIGHALLQYNLVGCSAFAAWDSFTTDGALLVGRNFDFSAGDAFARHRVVQFVKPDSGYRYIAVSWPGFCGVVSGLNEKGLAVTINASASRPPLQATTPISLLVREIIQYAGTLDEAVALARKRRTFVSESILVASGDENRALIIEKTPDQTVIYQSSYPLLLCTNHYQSDSLKQDSYHKSHIIVPDSPYRWETLWESIMALRPLTPGKAVSILRRRDGLKGDPLGLGNPMALNQLLAHHAVVIHPARRIIWVASPPWQLGTFVAYQLDSAFGSFKAQHPYTDQEFLNIPQDAWFFSPERQSFLHYKKLEKIVAWLARNPSEKVALSDTTLQWLTILNPHYYNAYKTLGEYFASRHRVAEARAAYKKALQCAIPDKRIRLSVFNSLKALEED